MMRALKIIRQKLFATPLDAVITLAVVFLLWRILVPVVDWMLLDANFAGTTRADCTAPGACWVFVRARFGQFMYGLYPPSERWRVDLAGGILVITALLLFWKALPYRRVLAVAALIVLPPLGIWLLGGGLGLPNVETREWGGLMLTVFISLYAGLIAIPFGILLALGRRSELPVIRMLSIIFIEFWRGVPIVAVIFLASILLPLIMPSGVGVDRLARAVIGLGLVIAAYMAEAVRGGLQAIPEGQHDAAAALGLGYWRATGFIILPQALRISLPAITNEFIALIKNTTLVLIVSILDLLGIAQAALADPNWVGMNKEAYVFAGLLYWIGCFSLSRFAFALEKKRAKAEQH
jgi:general L-amino acid transport system permease protein